MHTYLVDYCSFGQVLAALNPGVGSCFPEVGLSGQVVCRAGYKHIIQDFRCAMSNAAVYLIQTAIHCFPIPLAKTRTLAVNRFELCEVIPQRFNLFRIKLFIVQTVLIHSKT